MLSGASGANHAASPPAPGAFPLPLASALARGATGADLTGAALQSLLTLAQQAAATAVPTPSSTAGTLNGTSVGVAPSGATAPRTSGGGAGDEGPSSDHAAAAATLGPHMLRVLGVPSEWKGSAASACQRAEAYFRQFGELVGTIPVGPLRYPHSNIIHHHPPLATIALTILSGCSPPTSAYNVLHRPPPS